MTHAEELDIFGYTVIEPEYTSRLIADRYITLSQQLDALGSDFAFGMLNHRPETWDMATDFRVCSIAMDLLGSELRIGAVACKRLKPGAPHLRIHTDGTDPLKHIPHFPFMINTIFCVTDFTEENGAFCVVPFSHKSPLPKSDVLDLFNNADIENDMIKPIPVECTAGSVILWDSRIWHGHFPNTTNQNRLNVNISYYPKWFNILIEQNHEPVHPCIFTQMPRELQEMVRYKVGTYRGDVYEYG